MQLNVRITQRDIKQGERSNPKDCAIAKSLKRNRNLNASSVCVFYDKCVVQVQEQGRVQNYVGSLNDVASTFVHRFDHRKMVKPFSFKIELHKASKDDVYATEAETIS